MGLLATITVATAAAFWIVARRTGASVLHVAERPSWPLLVAAFAVSAGVQPLRAWAWATTARVPIGFRAVYAASAVGSFLDCVLPARLGEGSKVAVLRVASGPKWPGLPRAGGSLLCAHMLEMVAFAIVGSISALFLPLPTWARVALLAGLPALLCGFALAALLHRRARWLPDAARTFLAAAAAPRGVLMRAGGILVVTWVARGAMSFLLLHAVGIEATVGGALLYMLVTGLANTAPVLPGNAGIYQGAALGALALAHEAGSRAVAASLLAPAVMGGATAVAALVGLALYGRRFFELQRAALTAL
jgi:uncharacterized membrane protein YbhN (UPF0104 family)